ncbi:MAG: 4'-phosphopantetheinyl transferase superfamily protein [Saprospiraceae bacterium]|nr:4'-phosphopantetheinyl transferase superfamily protein [Saprospiraceae bacterium]
MPLIESKCPEGQSELYIWSIEEDDAFFLNAMDWDERLIKWLTTIHPLRRIEYLASRYLIFSCTGKNDAHLFKNETGKLFIRDSQKHLSISHSAQWTGLAMSIHPVGFDLQAYRDKITSISKRFLSEAEQKKIQQAGMMNTKDLCAAWSIKEAVYKAHGNKGIIFSEQIELDVDAEQAYSKKAFLHLSGMVKSFQIWYEKNEKYVSAMALEI